MTSDFDSSTDPTHDDGDYVVTLRCEKCGSDELTIPDEPTDDSRATCSKCGADLGRWGDIQAAAFEAAIEKTKESAADIFGKAFDGVDGISFKNSE